MVARLLGIRVRQLCGPKYLELVWDNCGGQSTWSWCGTIVVAKLLGISVGQLWGPNYSELVWDNLGGQTTWN